MSAPRGTTATRTRTNNGPAAKTAQKRTAAKDAPKIGPNHLYETTVRDLGSPVDSQASKDVLAAASGYAKAKAALAALGTR